MLISRLRDELGRPVSAASLVAFRIAFGTIMLWEVYRYLSNGWIATYYDPADFHFTYPFFGWVRPWPGDFMETHFWVLGGLAILIALGAAYRASATLFFLGFTYVFLLERAQYLNHFYLICLVSFLMIVVPAHRAFSIDARTNPRLRSATVPAWAVWLLRFQIAVPYFYGGLAKLDGDWLAGEPMRTWMSWQTGFPLIGRWFTEEWMVFGASLFGLLLDLLVVPALLWRRTRPWAYAAACAFHLMNTQLFLIGIFPWFMIAATTIFFEPDWPLRIVRRLRRAPSAAVATPAITAPSIATPAETPVIPASAVTTSAVPTPAVAWRPLRRPALALLAAWVAVQMVVPLRHFLYPGDANWTEEGHTFSWHMKLRDKHGKILFVAVDRATGDREPLNHWTWLSERQVEKMATRPYMIQQFARHLAQHLRERGDGDYEVRVESEASLNGRRYQRLIDPAVNLGAEPVSLLPVSWIVPLRTPLERHGPFSAEADYFESSD